MAQKKRHALAFTLGGAPLTPHVIAGLPGHFRPNVPRPVGEEGEITLDEAKTLAKEHSDVLELVELSADEAKKASEVHEATAEAVRESLPDAAAVAEGAEVALVNDEKAALAATKE